MNELLRNLKEISNKTLTQNGAVTYASTINLPSLRRVSFTNKKVFPI